MQDETTTVAETNTSTVGAVQSQYQETFYIRGWQATAARRNKNIYRTLHDYSCYCTVAISGDFSYKMLARYICKKKQQYLHS